MQKVVGSNPIIRFFIVKKSPVMRGPVKSLTAVARFASPP
jgi:hypothetical protein